MIVQYFIGLCCCYIIRDIYPALDVHIMGIYILCIFIDYVMDVINGRSR